MARRVRVTAWYARELGRTLQRGSPGAVAVARAVRALMEAAELPGASDFEATVRPVGRAWVRRVPGFNLWLWYRWKDEELVLVTVTTVPPVPLDA